MTAPDYAALERDLDRAALEIEAGRDLMRLALALERKRQRRLEGMREPEREDEQVRGNEVNQKANS
jgi:hypothetical protein